MKQEISHRTPPSGHRHSNIGAQGIHTEEGREAFLAQPLPQHDSAHGSADGVDEDYDEEVAVDFRARGGASAQLRSPTAARTGAASSGNVGNVKPSGNVSTGAGSSDAVKGAGRGAALMRRYEGNQHPAPPSVPAPAPAPVPVPAPSPSSAVLRRGVTAPAAPGPANVGAEADAALEETDL